MQIDIVHETTYHFDRPLVGALQELRVSPDDWACQRVDGWELEFDGGVLEVSFRDHHSNQVQLVSLEPGVLSATVRSRGCVETTDTHGVVTDERGFAPRWLYGRSTELTTAGPLVAGLLERFEPEDAEPLPRMHALSDHVRDTIEYDPGWTNVASTAEHALEAGHGVCQDHAHVFVTAARALGVPARYVSGYLLMDEQAGQEAAHAWAEVFVDGLGWVGFDVANRVCPDDRYVRLAVGLDYREAAPVSGLRFGDSNEILEVALQVQQ
ncbi:MAG: transglutaminase family protein [Acidimicrobiales bacterium]|nr:transglutaminase family protein [Acidimicrobiales bacterium]